MISHVFESSLIFNQSLQQLCGGLINDQVFKVNFAIVKYELALTTTIPDIYRTMFASIKKTNYDALTSFWFQSFSPDPIKICIEKFNWDWVSFTLQYCEYLKELFQMKDVINFDTDFSSLFSEISSNMYNVANRQPNEETQLLFDKFFSI